MKSKVCSKCFSLFLRYFIFERQLGARSIIFLLSVVQQQSGNPIKLNPGHCEQ